MRILLSLILGLVFGLNSVGVAQGAEDEPKVKWKGEFRARYEYERQPRPVTVARSRELIRARLGMDARPLEEVQIRFQLSTGSGSPISRNAALGDGFITKSVQFEHAYAIYNPNAVKELQLWLGKMDLPFVVPIDSQLIWDNEVRPEGVAFIADKKNELARLRVTAGHFLVKERPSSTDCYLGVVQALVSISPKSVFDSVNFGASWYPYNNINAQAAFDTAGTGAGNTIVGGNYVETYKLVELFVEPTVSLGSVPVSVAYQMVKNYAVRNGKGSGWLAGIKVGKNKEAGDWMTAASWRRLEKDSVVGAFTESDFAGGGADVEGLDYQLGYTINSVLQVKGSYRNGFRNISGAKARHQLAQADLNFRF